EPEDEYVVWKRAVLRGEHVPLSRAEIAAELTELEPQRAGRDAACLKVADTLRRWKDDARREVWGKLPLKEKVSRFLTMRHRISDEELKRACPKRWHLLTTKVDEARVWLQQVDIRISALNSEDTFVRRLESEEGSARERWREFHEVGMNFAEI